MATLSGVMTALGITGTYQEETVRQYYDDVVDFLIGAGVPENSITDGLVARGVSDLWNYDGGGSGKLSPYFLQRATQLSYGGG